MDEQNWKRYFRVFNLFNFCCFFCLIKCNEQDKKKQTNQPTIKTEGTNRFVKKFRSMVNTVVLVIESYLHRGLFSSVMN